jgi:predicted helicase
VRAVDDILKGSFGIPDGLADNQRVTVLDFACGTGTFLLEVFQRIFDNIGGPDSGRAGPIVREHFLSHIFGFEYLIAPYTIAHLKLSQYLKDKDHPLKDNERLQVFLTNTLEPVEPQKHLLLPAVTAEVEAAQKVKDREILVITGNPPYAGHSKNPSERVIEETVRERRARKGVIKLKRPKAVRRKIKTWIGALIDDYKLVDGKPLGERNPKWLNDDYVKFIRFAQWKMDAVEEGIVGVITNHSWLDNPTFRGMRRSLMHSFEQIHVLDLHGNAKKKERAPDGSKDENVFDIEQGVAISVFVKRPGLERGVWRGDLWGKRLEKYQATADGTLAGLTATPANPTAPNFLFLIQDTNIRHEYEKGWSINSIMTANSIAIVTGHDSLAYAFSEQELRKRLQDFARDDPEEARSKYGLGRDTADWSVGQAQKDVKTGGQLVKTSYRPFDQRFTFYTGRARGFHVRPRQEVMQHLLSGSLALNVCRFVTRSWQHALVINGLADNCLISTQTKERGYIFPIVVGANENLSAKFRAFLDSRYEHHYTPEEVLGHIYAVLHAPTYRKRYAELLRIDFPRVPFPESAEHFEKLSVLGWALAQAHLLRELPRSGLAIYHGKGDHMIEDVRYSPADQAVAINKTQFFKPVPQAVWDFYIGGYQVLDKYLKSRRGRALSLDEINHVGAVGDSIAFTIEQMAKIDEAYRAAFPDRG